MRQPMTAFGATVFFFVLLAAGLAAQDPVLVDRIVAVVDEEAIFLSDVEQAIAIGQLVPRSGEGPEKLRRQVLDRLIDQRLQLHEVERFDAGQVAAEDVERQVEAIRARFEDEASWQAWLTGLGLDEAGVRHLVRRQLRVLAYVEERLGPRIFVDLDDIRAYYAGELKAEMESRGERLPPIAEVREAIRALLRERRLNAEIRTWVRELRLEADVVDYLERRPDELPPVVEVIEGGG
jgi:parvulin-like peptidyl-prolyl isomerase